MLFSVVIPVYNVEKFLPECVESILGQNFCELEIILVDDGSTDGSGTICDSYSTKYNFIKTIHQANGGASAARNAGLAFAKGDYVLFIDSDDFISSGSLKEIKKTIENAENPELVLLECEKFYADGGKKLPMNDGVTEEINCLSGDELYKYLAYLNKFPASPCTKAIRRDFLFKNKLYFEKGKLSEDLEWAMRLFVCAEKVAYCRAPYYNYRQGRAGSSSASYTEKHMFNVADAANEGCKLAEMQNSEAKKLMLYSFVEYIYRILILGYRQIGPEKRKEYKKQLRKCSYVLGVRKDRASKLVRMAYKILGPGLTSKLLNIYLKGRESGSF